MYFSGPYFRKLVSVNHFTIFDHSDFDPIRPIINSNLYLKMLHLCSKHCFNKLIC